MSIHDQDHYRALILNDPRFNATNATISPANQQAGPTVNEPKIISGEGYMDLEAVGTSTADRSYQIKCTKPGNAVGTDRGGRWAWKLATEPDTSWRGWMPYGAMTISQVFALETTTKVAVAWPHAITTSDEYVHMVYSEVEGLSATPSGAVKVATLNPATDTWTIVNVSTSALGSGSVGTRYYGPCTIVELPSGRLLVFVDRFGSQIDSFYSDDRGATWNKAQSHSDSNDESYGIEAPTFGSSIKSVIHFQAVYHNGYITLIREIEGSTSGNPHEIDHYVSDDFGGTFELIERFQPDLSATTGKGTSVADVYDPKLVVDLNGQVLMYYATDDELIVGRQIKLTRKSSPYAKFADHSTFGTRPPLPAGDYDSQGRFTVCTDSEGFVAFVHQRTLNTVKNQTGQAFINRSTHREPSVALTDARGRGEFFTMSDTGTSDTQWPILSQTGEIAAGSWTAQTDKINRSTLTPYKEGLLLITGGLVTQTNGNQATTTRGSCLQIHLGGTSSYDLINGFGYFQYIPMDTAKNVEDGHSTFGVVGTSSNTTETIEADGCKFVSTSGRAAYGWSSAVSMMRAQVRGGTAGSLSGGNLTGNYGTLNMGNIEVRFSQDYAQVWDKTSGANALSALLTLPDKQRQWWITYESTSPQKAWVMHKLPYETVWNVVPMLNTLAGSVSTTAYFGNDNLDTMTNWFQSVYVGTPMTATSRDWSQSDYHPKYLYGRPFSVYPTYMDQGWQLESKGSAAFVDDSWTAQTGYEHSVESIDTAIASSPRVAWRSLDDTTEITIEWLIDNGTASTLASNLIGVHLSSVNFKTAYFETFSGGSWTTVGTFDTATDHSLLKYNLTGNAVTPQASGTYGSKRFVAMDELVNSYAVFDAGGGSETVRRIKSNGSGSFSATSGTVHAKPAQLIVDGSVSGIANTGNFEVRENSATLIVGDHTTAHTKYRLRIPAQKTAEGYFTIGACIVGPVAVFGQDYSWGRTVELQPNQEITTGRSGDRIVEKLGPLRRQVQFAWGEGWDATKTQGLSPTEFDLIDIGLSNAVAVRNNPKAISAALTRLSGAKETTVYLPRLPHMNGTQQTITGKDRNIYGRIVSPVTETTVLGDEGTDEVITINQIVIDEEV